MGVINIQDVNPRDLEKIQKIVQMEDGVAVSLGKTLAKVLTFFKKFVPYK